MLDHMFGRRKIKVSVGDVFVEPLDGKKRIFRVLGIVDSVPAEEFQSTWNVEGLSEFNGLPHARLFNPQSGAWRIIALSTLEAQEGYVKSRRSR